MCVCVCLCTREREREREKERERERDECCFYNEQVVFFQGVAPPLRKEVWPFLLGLYPFYSSERERSRIRSRRLEEYWTINKHRFMYTSMHA